MISLITQHGIMGAGVPLPVGLALQVPLANQRFLYFLHPIGLQTEARQPLLAGKRAALIAVMRVARGSAFVR